MDVGQLRAFLAVAEDLHFGRAADRLHVAQPYLSRTIRALEKDLGAPLFVRTTRRVTLTAAGTALVEHARAIVTTDAAARAAVSAAHKGRSGRVRMSFAGPSAHITVGELARAVRERHPLIDVEFLPGRYGTAAVAELLRGEADLALARFTTTPVGVRSRVVARDRCVVAVPSDHRLARHDSLTFSDFRDEPFVAFPESYGSVVRDVFVSGCHAAGFAPTFAQTAPDSWTSVALVAAGVGLHFTSSSAVARLPLDGVVIREISDQVPPILVHLVWRRADDNPALAQVLHTAAELLPDVAGTP
ncbi:LysR family transcriptional regulator [Kibdelosporangium persicum]|uniref:HTH-type transcriptional regulator CatM n=1 Tax=Kibdelosporangium persicum TaxID=2698649 RepID=A0ABX2FFY9_9PSEU|nr:LysR family transcriptional regulator [Kibdelosporangium persicum]NRN69645.1 HTH-type transcriptional regulator CatM [Kibdelosporangium persicum]